MTAETMHKTAGNVLQQTFKAQIDARPGHPHNLSVTGEIQVPTTGFKATLRRAQPQGSNALDLILNVSVESPHGIQGDIVSTVNVHHQEHPAQAQYTNVTIRHGAQTFTIPVARLA